MITIALFIIAILFASLLFSYASAVLIMVGIEASGGEPGSIVVMFVGLLVITLLLSVVVTTAMLIAKKRYHKSFPARWSVVLFLLLYLPFQINGLFFPDDRFDSLATLLSVMFFFSFIPFFHCIAQSLINLAAFIRQRNIPILAQVAE